MQVATNGNVSFWYAQMGGTPSYRAPLTEDMDVDVCIIGAGFTGLWTAYYLMLARPSLRVALIEQQFAGFGASGRNGGWCTGSFGWKRERYVQGTNRDGLIALETQLRGTVDEILRVAKAEGIDADIRRTDCVTYACSPAQMRRLKVEHDTALRWDVPAERVALIGTDEAKARIKIANAHGALVERGGARVQPAKLVRGLAAAVERKGACIYEQTTVEGIAPGLVTTDRGFVRADRIICATEGFTAGIPGHRRKWLPLNSAQIVTAPLPAALWDSIGWTRYEMLGDASHAYCYAQRTADGRIAMGGRGVPYRFGSRTDRRGETQTATIEALAAILHRLLPQTRSVALEHAWCGVLGVPRDWCATVGLDPQTGIGWAGGYVGIGVSTSNHAGRTLADLILEQHTERTGMPWVGRTPRNWEPEPLRWLAVHGMYHLYHLADKREAAGTGHSTSRLARLADWITQR
ncbi:NAD(P)/FAD-dependent oxidoreductase [Meridianimarinicoccus aquatilis]|uniref:FAD-dependent oxidoreductase n=1 Tax=Meridianimarinicoccus aquatilis TaxID=2552766 RepID=A0A4R6AUU1_9RHOB|nr:FAD-binding oxidoreductase [Fluviibacterium aquatile]TDL87980.1 FAD-dependent oxidoreductase [Fluviibacterium aquatile]